MTKNQLLFSISSKEISEWKIEYKIREEERRREEAKAKTKGKRKR